MAVTIIENKLTGTFTADADVIAQDTTDTFLAVFGGDLNTAPESTAGRLIEYFVGQKTEMALNLTAYVSQAFNPDLAGGAVLDAHCANLGIIRKSATKTIVTAIISGSAGVIVPAGFRARATDGNVYSAINGGTIDGTGHVTLQFVAEDAGQVLCDAGELSELLDYKSGISSVNNPTAGIIGIDAETDAQLRARRIASTGMASLGTLQSVYARLFTLPSLRSAFVQENKTSGTLVINNISMLPHSIYVCAEGGVDTDIAKALIATKSIGCNYTNNAAGSPSLAKSVTIMDDYGVSNTVLYDVAEEIFIDVKVTVKQGRSARNLTEYIPDVVYTRFSGSPTAYTDNDGWIVGGSILHHEISATINAFDPNIIILKTEIKKSTDPTFAQDVIVLEKWQVGKTSRSSVTVNIVS
jgi:hypothetical protein